MSKRRSTPKLMDNLLSGNRPAGNRKPENQDNSLPVNQTGQETFQTSKRQESRFAAHAMQAHEDEKAKATFYIAQDVQYDLDAAQIQLRRWAPRYVKKQQLSKSAIVEAALRLAYEELEQKGPNSQLAQMLFS